MVEDHLSSVFFALADPTRRGVLARLARGDATVKELAEPYAMSVAAVSKHLKVLEAAGLVSQGRQSQWRPRHLEPAPLQEVYAWLEDYFVVTSQRLLLAEGVFKKTVNMMPLGKVTDMRFERSATARLLGYGTFIVESAGQDQALSKIDHLPYPEQLYIEVCGLIFKDPGSGDD